MEKMPKTIGDAIHLLNTKFVTLLPNRDLDIVKILEYVFELNETGIINRISHPVSAKQNKRLSNVIERLQNGEPLEYITGTAYFYSNQYKVTKDTLIPRSETEMLVDLALSEINNKIYDPETTGELSIIDIGTGSGCIAIALAHSIRKPVKILATDRSERALSIARENIKNSGYSDTIITFKSDLLEEVPSKYNFDVVVANLPYIPQKDLPKLPKSVKNFEPHMALNGGENGIKIIQKLLTQLKKRLNEKATILIEMDPKQLTKVGKVAQTNFPNSTIEKAKDLSGKERFLIIKT